MKKYYSTLILERTKHWKKALMAIALMVLCSFHGLAQERTVSGTVNDDSGEPLPGTNVVIKGTTTGTVTDFNGTYRINVPNDAVLVISAIGFITQEVSIGSRSVIDVDMALDIEELEEVVVVGYTSQSKRNLTGAVSSVDIGEATKVPLVNAAEALQGRAAGVSVITDGAPGAAPTVRIRGFGTPNSNDPLYIIDGVQTNDPSVLSTLNPQDIEQMNVLKDGAASIYGSRASNGVVIITTKKGKYKDGKPTISFDAFWGTQRVINELDLLNAQQHGEMIFQSLRNDGADVTHPQYGSGSSPVVPSSLLGVDANTTVNPNGTDWQDEIFRDAPFQNYSLSVQNATDNGQYFLSVGYADRDGIQLESGFKRGSTRLNSEFSAFNGRVRVGEHLNIAFSRTNLPLSRGNNVGNQVENALRSSPLIPARDNDGNFAGTYSASAGLGNARSPLAQLVRARDNYDNVLQAFGDIYLEADILEQLTFKTSIGANVSNLNGRVFTRLDPEHSESITSNLLAQIEGENYEWVWSNTLNYDQTFGDHGINVLAGIESVYNQDKLTEVRRSDILIENSDFLVLRNGTGTPQVITADDNQFTLFSVFGSVNYSFKNRYLATFTIRGDETSRFSRTNQNAVFPAFTLGWVISEEDFFPQNNILTYAKIKGSYGELGNQSLPQANPDVNISQLDEQRANYVFSGSGTPTTGAILNSVGNPDLKWETSQSTNFGLDLGLINNKLNIGIEYFRIVTDDLIVQDFSAISSTAIDAGAPFVNVGEVENTGIDLRISYADQTSFGLTYGIDLVLSRYDNEVTDLISDFQTGATYFRGGAVTRSEVGQPLSSFYGRVVEGIFQSASEVSAAPDQGFADPADGVGRFRYRDVNGDGVINDDDRDYIGSPHPDFTYGINLNLGFKGVDVTAFFTGSQGNDIYNYQKIFTDFPTFFNGNRSTRVLDSWSESNTGAELPALSQSITNSETQPNSYFVEDGSFFRLKNLQIGYNIPNRFGEVIGLSSARVYLQGTNLFTITDYDGFDPELGPDTNNNDGSSDPDNLTLGVDSGRFYPQAKIFSVGINAKF